MSAGLCHQIDEAINQMEFKIIFNLNEEKWITAGTFHGDLARNGMVIFTLYVLYYAVFTYLVDNEADIRLLSAAIGKQ